MPDDERTRRRLGDATKARIDDLAAGWSVDAPASPPPALPPIPPPAPPAAAGRPVARPATLDVVPDSTPTTVAPEPRDRPRTHPPPPPGSTERKAIEAAILDAATARATSGDTLDDDARLSAVELPPPPAPKASPPPTPRAATSTKPPPIPAAAANASGALRMKSPSAPQPVPHANASGPVPRGEFDDGALAADQDAKLRVHYAQSTTKRDAAEALLGIPSTATRVQAPTIEVLLGETADKLVRGDPTLETSTSPFSRADPTAQQRDDATTIEPPSRLATVGGTLRPAAALRRKRGLAGDVRYVFTALFGVRSARRELDAIEDKQRARQAERRRHLTTLGRTAVVTDGFDHPALGKAREALAAVEDERSKHAGAVAASDAEQGRVKRDRAAASKTNAGAIAAADTELAELAKKLEPLEKDAATARKQAAALADQLRRIARRIADTEALLVSVKSEKLDRAGIQADIATLRADQQAIQRDEPKIASELDALDPRIASIRAARAEADGKKTAAQDREAGDLRRTAELYEAIGAKRKVVERAAGEAEAARERVLFELGERLYVDRPGSLAAQLSPIDEIDLELGESDRRVMELREILSNVDKLKIARGAGVIVLALGAVGAFTAWLLYMLL